MHCAAAVCCVTWLLIVGALNSPRARADFRVYTVALNEEDIRSIVNWRPSPNDRTPPPAAASLQVWYPFNETFYVRRRCLPPLAL